MTSVLEQSKGHLDYHTEHRPTNKQGKNILFTFCLQLKKCTHTKLKMNSGRMSGLQHEM